MPHGKAQYDKCDVCGGDDDTCVDCHGNSYSIVVCLLFVEIKTNVSTIKGVPNGPGKYDVCDVCGGDGSSCAPKCGNQCLLIFDFSY